LSIDEPDIPVNVQIMMVLAISNNDLDNLLLCNKARHHFPDVYLIAKCNDALYQDIFKDTGVHQIINSNYSEVSIIEIIMNSSVQGLYPTSTPDDRRIVK
jgi:Trk K+ transport system NAD-binding subunit